MGLLRPDLGPVLPRGGRVVAKAVGSGSASFSIRAILKGKASLKVSLWIVLGFVGGVGYAVAGGAAAVVVRLRW